MLRELKIENIAVIERADIRFDEGLNVMTGETGYSGSHRRPRQPGPDSQRCGPGDGDRGV